MASHPPAQCCTVGVKFDGETVGKLETINGGPYSVSTGLCLAPFDD